MSATFLRQLAMLQLLPRYPKKETVSNIREELDKRGYPVHKRTVERDLNAFSRMYPLLCDERSKPHGWSWDKNGPVLDIPGMEPIAALGFQLADIYLAPMLPKTTLAYLAPHFKRAREILEQSTHGGYSQWASKVRVIPRGLDLMPAVIERDVEETVYRALFEGRYFRVEYTPKGSAAVTDYEVNPLGLVFRQGVVYLVCTLWAYHDIKQLALHRMRKVEKMDRPVKAPPGFDLDDYVKKGEFSYPVSSKPLKLRLRFAAGAARHLLETPLSEDQTLSPCQDGGTEVRATVLDTAELRWWLLGFGQWVEVLAPRPLREEFGKTASHLHQRYHG